MMMSPVFGYCAQSLMTVYVMKGQLKALWNVPTAKTWRVACGSSGCAMPTRAVSRP